ncbi:hypothetical protein ANABIO32_18700 [Rossellomorea marisflavi]|nr:hypothetical protein ANABIO32_18700 [Rossellomorea marisflavi]
MVGIRKDLSIRRVEEQRLTGEGATTKLYGLAVALYSYVTGLPGVPFVEKR